MNEWVSLALGQYGPQILEYIIWLVGIVIGLVLYKRNPRSMLLLIIAFATFLVSSLFFTTLTVSIIYNQYISALTAMEIGTQLGLITLVRVVINSIAWITLLAAVFLATSAGRSKNV